jgi:hypothetical protein
LDGVSLWLSSPGLQRGRRIWCPQLTFRPALRQFGEKGFQFGTALNQPVGVMAEAWLYP